MSEFTLGKWAQSCVNKSNPKRENKVTKEDMEKLPKIVAVDFDGTLVSDYYPEIGEINRDEWERVLAYKALGWKVVLWTCRDGAQLFSAVTFCAKHGLTFDAVNENIPEIQKLFNNDTRKVYADLYLDDKMIPLQGKVV